ncbi:MAG: 50S ribosomal protein L17 [Chloroflexi bacterium]|nr:50S ribosomal protein L17 [Chloroflexota bacterium]
MRHRLSGRKLGRDTSHRLHLLRNQATDLFRYERIQTTEAKAREVQRLAEKMVTLAKAGDLHSRRQAYATLFDPRIVDKLFMELKPRFGERRGGHTRLVKLGARPRDGAPMAVLELVF